MVQDGGGIGSVETHASLEFSQTRRALLDSANLRDLLRLDPAFPFDAVLIDMPRFESPIADPQSSARWARQVDRLLRIAAEVVSADGAVIVECDDQALPFVIEDAQSVDLELVHLVAWQKKYSAQQDAVRLIHPLHDWLIVLRLPGGEQQPDLSLLSYSLAGKSEDAAKEFQKEMPGSSWSAPQALKPRRLYRWVADTYLSTAGRVLDLTCCGASASTVLSQDVLVVEVFQQSGDLQSSLALAHERSGLDYDALVRAHQGPAIEDLEHIDVLSKKSPLCKARPIRVQGDRPEADAFQLIAADPVVAAHGMSCFAKESAAAAVIPFDIFAASPSEWLSVLTIGGVLFVQTAVHHLHGLVQLIDPLEWQGTLLVPTSDSDDVTLYVLLGRSGLAGDTRNIGVRKAHEYTDGGDLNRGPYRIPTFKDAKSGSANLDYNTYAPPYNWMVTEGSLPEGMWRVNPLTGVLWGIPTSEGRWEFRVEVWDEEGNTASAWQIVEVVRSPAVQPTMLQFGELAWVAQAPSGGGHSLEVVAGQYVVDLGRETSIALQAAGGVPRVREFTTPGKVSGEGRTRWWPCSRAKLKKRIRRDLVEWGKKGGRPRRRRYKRDDERRAGPFTSIQEPGAGGSFPWGALSVGMLPRVEVTRDEQNVSTLLTKSPGAVPVDLVLTECDACLASAPLACSLDHAAQETGLLPAGGGTIMGLPGTYLARDLMGRHSAVITALPLTEELERLLIQICPGERCLSSRARDGDATGVAIGRLAC